MERTFGVLSKCCVWRLDILKILVTIGSMAGCKFTRLFKIVDELCEERVLDKDKVIAQTGCDNYKSSYYKTFDMLPDEKFKKLIAESDVIISHAGTGTVTSCLKKGKKVILFPRLEEYGEHYDNHQLDLCDVFVNKGYTLCAKDKTELKVCLENIVEFVPRQFKSHNEYINDLIIDFIETKNKPRKGEK